MKRILITGGAGFIGSNLAAFLTKKDYHITIIDNLLTGSEHNINILSDACVFIKGDICDADVFSKLDNTQFEIIYHLASPASPKQYNTFPIETLRVNSLGTQNVLDYMIASKSKTFVFTSTSEIYGDPLVHPQKEDYWGNVNPNGKRACYDEAKRYGEALCMTYYRKFHLDIRIARIFNTYGSNMEKDDGRVISNFITQALQNIDITVYGDGSQTRSFCYIDDLCEGLYSLGIKNVAGQVINLGSVDEKNIAEIAQIIKKMTKSSSNIINKDLPPDDPKKRKPDISKAKELLDWKPSVSLENGLAQTITYFKERFSL